MSKKKTKKSAAPSVPRIFKNPLPPIMALMAVNAVALVLAAVLRNIADKTAVYSIEEGGTLVTATAADRFGGIIMAVLLVLAAGITAFIIIGCVVRANKDGVFPAGGIVVALFLLAVSVGIIIFAVNFASGEKPKSVSSIGYEDDLGRHILISEEEYRSHNRLKVYAVHDDYSADLVAGVELLTLSDDLDSRYKLSAMGDTNITLEFADGNSDRTISFELAAE